MIEVVGIGAAGWASLGPAERDLVQAAEVVVGARRLLGLLPPVPRQRREPLPPDLRAALPGLLAGHEGRATVVLASGDPLVAGIGATVLDLFSSGTVRIHPAVSSLALARARMGWDAESVETVRLRTEDDLDTPPPLAVSRAADRRALPRCRDPGAGRPAAGRDRPRRQRGDGAEQPGSGERGPTRPGRGGARAQRGLHRGARRQSVREPRGRVARRGVRARRAAEQA